MDATSLQTIADWAGGKLSGGDGARLVTSICTDSRKLQAGDVFLALRGEKFDAHTFVETAAKQGAVAAIVEEAPANVPADFTVIIVADTLAALQQIAAHYRRSLPLKVVAITGSNGKTSTKDFTAAVLGERFRVTKTQGNFNNHIGLPLTMLGASAADEIGVFEIGMNHPGEIAPLAALAKADVGVITNIGMAHIEFMKTRDAIAQEKGMLAESIGSAGHVVMPADDDYVEAISRRTKAAVVLAGIDNGEVRATDVRSSGTGSTFTVLRGGERCEARLGIPGAHMVRNALLAIAVGGLFGLTLEQSVAGLSRVELTKGRLEQKTIRGIQVLDDTYNANPDSVIAALRTLAEIPIEGRRIAVLGQMNELGAETENGHRRVGEAAGREGIDCVLTVGERASLIAESARHSGVKNVVEAGSAAEATTALRELATAGDLVLVKGSRSARLEQIVEGLAAV